MTAIMQVEYRPNLLWMFEDILQSLGHPVVSVLGSRTARNLDLSDRAVGGGRDGSLSSSSLGKNAASLSRI